MPNDPCGARHARCLKRVLAKNNRCPHCRRPGPDGSEPLQVTTALRDAIARLFPAPLDSAGARGGRAESTRDEIADGLADVAEVRRKRWFADLSRSLAERRQAVVAGSAPPPHVGAADSLAAAAGPAACIPQEGLERLLRRAGCLMELPEVYGEMRWYLTELLGLWIAALPPADGSEPRGVLCDDVLASIARTARFCGQHVVPRSLYGFGGAHGFRFIWATSIVAVMEQVHPELRVGARAVSTVSDMVSESLRSLLDAAAESTDLMGVGRGSELVMKSAGPRDGGGDHDDSHRVLVCYSGTAGRQDSDSMEVPVLTLEAAGAAVAAVLPCELRTHADKEGHKALEQHVLQVSPMHVALFASRAGAPVLDSKAAEYLAAVVEYLIAELLEVYPAPTRARVPAPPQSVRTFGCWERARARAYGGGMCGRPG